MTCFSLLVAENFVEGVVSLIKILNLFVAFSIIVIISSSKNLKFFNSPIEAIKSSSGIAICTEWDEFKNYDWKNIYNLMDDSPWVFDGRNILNIKKIKGFGFNVYSIGK